MKCLEKGSSSEVIKHSLYVRQVCLLQSTEELPSSVSCVTVAAMLAKEALLLEATDLLFGLYQKSISLSVPQIAHLLNNLGKTDSLPEGLLETFLQASSIPTLKNRLSYQLCFVGTLFHQSA